MPMHLTDAPYAHRPVAAGLTQRERQAAIRELVDARERVLAIRENRRRKLAGRPLLPIPVARRDWRREAGRLAWRCIVIAVQVIAGILLAAALMLFVAVKGARIARADFDPVVTAAPATASCGKRDDKARNDKPVQLAQVLSKGGRGKQSGERAAADEKARNNDILAQVEPKIPRGRPRLTRRRGKRSMSRIEHNSGRMVETAFRRRARLTMYNLLILPPATALKPPSAVSARTAQTSTRM